MSELYRDYIDGKADEIINSLGGTITPAPANAELYRDFLDRKFDDVVNAVSGLKTLKSFEYTGNGQNPRTIQFPEKPMLFTIAHQTFANNSVYSDVVALDNKTFALNQTSTGTSMVRLFSSLSWNDTTKELTFSTGHLNVNNQKYTVYYI